jgi:hypothetical protein
MITARVGPKVGPSLDPEIISKINPMPASMIPPRSLGAPPPGPGPWPRRNLRLLAVFGPVLIATGIAGLLLPSRLSLMSGAAPYDVFHLVFGAIGTAFVLARSARLAALFNLVFGAIDLYQAAAGMMGIFPAQIFALRPADHVAHVVLGTTLVLFGVFAAPTHAAAGPRR